MASSLVRIPRHLLHVQLDDLQDLGIAPAVHDALRALIADLPLLPGRADSAQVIGPPEVTLPSLAVLARHIGQGLRDYNLTLAGDRARLRAERRKLLFLDAESLEAALAAGDPCPAQEAVLFVGNAAPSLGDLFRTREANGLASFIAGTAGLRRLRSLAAGGGVGPR